MSQFYQLAKRKVKYHHGMANQELVAEPLLEIEENAAQHKRAPGSSP